jgi:hypothetical protein
LPLSAGNQAAEETAAKIFDFDAFSTAPSTSLTYAQVAAKGAAPALQLGDHAAAPPAGFTTAAAGEPSTQMLPKELEPAADASHRTVMAFLESSKFPAAAESDRVDGFKDDQGSGLQADTKAGAGMEEKLNVHFADDESKAAPNDAKNVSEHSSDAGAHHERAAADEIGGDSASASANINSKKLTLDLDFMAD